MKGSKECLRSWVTARHDRLRICIFCGLLIHPCTAHMYACTHTCGLKPIACSNSLESVHPTRKGEDFPFVLLFLLVNPLTWSRGHTDICTSDRSKPLCHSFPCLVTSLTTNPELRAQHHLETSQNSSVLGRICSDLNLVVLCMGTVTLLPLLPFLKPAMRGLPISFSPLNAKLPASFPVGTMSHPGHCSVPTSAAPSLQYNIS